MSISNEQDPRVLRTRNLLQNALQELIQEKPFQTISVSDITRRATLNRATFYLHYLDKFDLLAKTARDTFTHVLKRRLPDSRDFELGYIRDLAAATCDYLQAFLRGCAPANKTYEPLIEAQIQQVLYGYVYGWLSGIHDKFEGTLRPEVIAMVVSSSVLNASLKWSRGETHYSASELADQLYEVLVSGILSAMPQIPQQE